MGKVNSSVEASLRPLSPKYFKNRFPTAGRSLFYSGLNFSLCAYQINRIWFNERFWRESFFQAVWCAKTPNPSRRKAWKKQSRSQKYKGGIKTSFGIRQWNTCGWKSTPERYGKHSKRNYCMPNGYVCHWAINTSELETRVKTYTRKWKKSSDVRKSSLKAQENWKNWGGEGKKKKKDQLMTWREQVQRHICFFHVWVSKCAPFIKILLSAILLSTVTGRVSAAGWTTKASQSSTSWSSCISPTACWIHPLPPPSLYAQHSCGSWWLFDSAFLQHQKASEPPCALGPSRAANYSTSAEAGCLYFRSWCAFVSVCPAACLSIDTYKHEFHVPRWWKWVYK